MLTWCSLDDHLVKPNGHLVVTWWNLMVTLWSPGELCQTRGAAYEASADFFFGFVWSLEMFPKWQEALRAKSTPVSVVLTKTREENPFENLIRTS